MRIFCGKLCLNTLLKLHNKKRSAALTLEIIQLYLQKHRSIHLETPIEREAIFFCYPLVAIFKCLGCDFASDCYRSTPASDCLHRRKRKETLFDWFIAKQLNLKFPTLSRVHSGTLKFCFILISAFYRFSINKRGVFIYCMICCKISSLRKALILLVLHLAIVFCRFAVNISHGWIIF